MSILNLYLGSGCNFNCIMCSVKGVDGLDFENSFSEMYKIMKEADEEVVSFTGGEPTINPDILRLFEAAKKLGYDDVRMTSNGFRFKDKEFVKKLTENNLTKVNLSLHGIGDVHKEVTGTKAYDSVMEGVKNLLSENVRVNVVSVLMSCNVDSLNLLYEKLLELGVSEIEIIDLQYDGRAKEKIDELAVSFLEKRLFFEKNSDLLKSFSRVRVVNFLPCLLPFPLPENFIYFSERQKKSINKFEGGLSGEESDKDRKKMTFCKECKAVDFCPGVKNKELDAFGEENFKKAASKIEDL